MTKSIDKSRQCPVCGVTPRRGLAADVVIMKDDSVLLVKRAFPPDRGCWAIPGGYVEWNESVEDAARREVNEETGLIIEKLQFVTLRDAPSRHPDQLITVLFLGEAHGELRAGDDAADAAWFPLDALPKNMALDHRIGVEMANSSVAKRRLSPSESIPERGHGNIENSCATNDLGIDPGGDSKP